MDRKQAHTLYAKLIDTKQITHVGVEYATKIEADKLRQFKKNGSLGIEKIAKVIEYMESRGFTLRDNEPPIDLLAEVQGRLEEVLRMLNNPTRRRDRKARILLNEIEVIHREYGPELDEMGKLPPE